MPAARALWVGTREAHEATGDAVVPEHMQLVLPSSLPLALRQSAGLLSLVDKEFRLRHAQADDALIALRQSLCIRWHLQWHHFQFVVGQHPMTRSNAVMESNNRRTHVHVKRYRRARSALCMLGPNCDNWSTTLKMLDEGDIKPLHQGKYADNEKVLMKKRQGGRTGVEAEANGEGAPDNAGESEGQRTISWIWMSPSVLRERPHSSDPSECQAVDKVTHDKLMHEGK